MVTGAAVWPGVHISDNWEEIVEEICRSNIIQRDNIKFARKTIEAMASLQQVTVTPGYRSQSQSGWDTTKTTSYISGM